MRIGLRTSLVCAGVVLVMAVLAFLHVRPVNGPSYFVWQWRSLPWDCWLLTIAGALPLLATICWMWRRPATTRRTTLAQLAALMLSSALLKCVVLIAQASPIDTRYAVDLIRSPWATSFFYDAARMHHFGSGWVPLYDELAPLLTMHTRNKPIGPVLYFYTITGAMGVTANAALVCAGGLIALASASIPAVYACVRAILEGEWTDAPAGTARSAALWAAALVAVAPGFILFPAKFDAIWIAISAVMILAWYRMIRVDRIWPWSIVLGATVALQTFFGFHQLALGAFMVAMPFILCRDRVMAQHFFFFVRHSLTVAGVAAGVHIVVNFLSGYDTLATLQANLASQRLFLEAVPARRAPYTTLWDLYDFALGFGWCGAIVFAAALLDRRIALNVRLIGFAALGQLLLIALTALIAAEASRCWLFMSVGPLVATGALLSRWSASPRVLVLVSVLIASLVLNGTMTFNHPWPDWPGKMPLQLIPSEWRALPKPGVKSTDTPAGSSATSETRPRSAQLSVSIDAQTGGRSFPAAIRVAASTQPN